MVTKQPWTGFLFHVLTTLSGNRNRPACTQAGSASLRFRLPDFITKSSVLSDTRNGPRSICLSPEKCRNIEIIDFLLLLEQLLAFGIRNCLAARREFIHG